MQTLYLLPRQESVDRSYTSMPRGLMAAPAQDIYSGRPPQYAAVVFDDPVLRRITPGNDTLAVGVPNWAAVAAAIATTASLQNGSAYSQAAGRGAALLFLLSKEFQVLQTMQRRFGELPPVNLMHNASAQHALPSLLSGWDKRGFLRSCGSCWM